jgi:hypothetical protein
VDVWWVGVQVRTDQGVKEAVEGVVRVLDVVGLVIKETRYPVWSRTYCEQASRLRGPFSRKCPSKRFVTTR